jgi:hypothetical protein
LRQRRRLIYSDPSATISRAEPSHLSVDVIEPITITIHYDALSRRGAFVASDNGFLYLAMIDRHFSSGSLRECHWAATAFSGTGQSLTISKIERGNDFICHPRLRAFD